MSELPYRAPDGAPVRALGGGRALPAGSIVDPALAESVLRYKRAVASRYAAFVGEEIDHLAQPPWRVSPKVDGEQWCLVVDGGEVFLANPRGRVICGEIPVLTEARALLAKVSARTVIAGELYAVRPGGRPRSGDVARALAEGEEGAARLGFFAFDLVEGGPRADLAPDAYDSTGRVPFEDYGKVLFALRALISGGKRLQVVPTEDVPDHAGLRRLWQTWVEAGKAEGMVVRSQGRTSKVKPVLTFDAVIVGYIERGEDPTQIRSILLAMMREDGTFQLVARCGNFAGEEERRAVLARVKDTEVPSNYREASSEGAVYRFIRPSVVVEVKATDVQSEHGDGDPVERMVLHWDGTAWRAAANRPSVSVLHPVFLRFRDDKQVDTTDVRIAQLLDRVSVAAVDERVAVVERPASTVVLRRVWTKETKGALAVRKVVGWATHKSDDARWPAYAACWTDYSPGRAQPLQREVVTAPDEATLRALVDGLVAENIKKGWTEVASR